MKNRVFMCIRVLEDGEREVPTHFECVPEAYYSDALAKVERLRAAILAAKRAHYYCEDCWYTCPKHPEGCCDDARRDGECDCGADKFNAEIDRVLAETADATG